MCKIFSIDLELVKDKKAQLTYSTIVVSQNNASWAMKVMLYLYFAVEAYCETLQNHDNVCRLPIVFLCTLTIQRENENMNQDFICYNFRVYATYNNMILCISQFFDIFMFCNSKC